MLVFFRISLFLCVLKIVEVIDNFLKESEIGQRYYLPQFLFASFYTDIRNALQILNPQERTISTTKNYYAETITSMANINLILDGYRNHSKCDSWKILTF